MICECAGSWTKGQTAETYLVHVCDVVHGDNIPHVLAEADLDH
jgi:hypothetical protein